MVGELVHCGTSLVQKRDQEDLILEIDRTVCAPWTGGITPEETQGGRVEANRTHTAADMAHKYAAEHGQQEVTLPMEFKRHTALFSDEEANKFPPS